jgi:glycosyltransferase involved in cell wall biosynthesis
MTHFTHSPDESAATAETVRVLHLVKGLGPGGAERLLVNQLETGSPSIEYTVARNIWGKQHLVAEIESTGAETLVIGGGRFWPLGLRAMIRRRSPDIVHAHSPLLAGVVRLLRASGQIDAMVVTTEHNRWPRHHRLTRAFNRHTARFDDARIAVSIDVRESMTAPVRATTRVLDHGVPVEKIRGLLVQREEMRSRLLGDNLQRTIIGIVANFRAEKGYDTFLDAVRIATSQRSDIVFLVVGQGPGEAAFRQAVTTSGLDKYIDVLGYRDDALLVMTAFDIFTLTSRHEGKPVSLMEAFALGIPAVCTRAGGIPEVIADGKNGLLVEIDDAAGVASAWLELVKDDGRRAVMAQAISNSAARFDASTATRSIESLYRELMA